MKIVHKGWAKPDDPIYQAGLTVGGQRMAASTKVSTTDKGKATHSKPDSLSLLTQIMEQQEQKNPALAAKKKRLLEILATSSPQPVAAKTSGKNSKLKRKG